jgi:hypothetical protein
MLAGLMLAAAGQAMIVAAPSGASTGDTLVVRRLEHAVGAPGRAPFFRWAEVGRVRVGAVRGDGTAEVVLVRGSFAPGDRVTTE